MTPHEIELLLHFNTSEMPGLRFRTACHQLVADGLLESDGEQYCITNRGRVYVEELCKVPLPQ